MQKYTCFNCHKEGHFARDCSSKSPKKSPSSMRGGPSSSLGYPLIQCPCGKGPCIVFVSNTEKNPGRKFYSCPVLGAGRCAFFKWCDEIKDNGPRIAAPKCSCGAGIARRETGASGPNAGRSYFVCPIRRGFGACKFFLWENTQEDSKVSECEDESKGYGSPQSTCHSHRIFDIESNNLHVSDDLSLEQPGNPEFGLQKADGPTDLPNSTIMSISSSQDYVLLTENQESGRTLDVLYVSQHDPSPFAVLEGESSALDSMNGNLVMQEAEPRDSMVEKTAIVRLTSQTAIPCRRRLEFCRQISAAVDISQRVIYPSFDPICAPRERDMLYCESSTVLSHCLFNAHLDKSSLSIPGEDPELWNSDLQKPPGLKRSSAAMDETGTSTMLKLFEQAEFYWNKLFTIRNSINPSDQTSMARGASEILSVLNGMSIDNNPIRCLKEFVDPSLRFDAIEQSICSECSVEELIELYNEQKVRFDVISRVHEKAVADFTASCKRLESLNEEASCVRDMLSEIENQLSCCEAETSNLKIHADMSSRDVLEFKKSMQEAEEALKLRKQREEELCAAKAASERIFGSRQDTCGLHLRKRRKIELVQLEESSTSQKAATE